LQLYEKRDSPNGYVFQSEGENVGELIPVDAGFENQPNEEEVKDMSMRFLLNTDK
jgi:hypothetical protein